MAHFEVFAISEEGTETIEVVNTEEEAKLAVLELQRELENKVWFNTTTLNRVVGFDYNMGPDKDWKKGEPWK